jgi:hypothetical protein
LLQIDADAKPHPAAMAAALVCLQHFPTPAPRDAIRASYHFEVPVPPAIFSDGMTGFRQTRRMANGRGRAPCFEIQDFCIARIVSEKRRFLRTVGQTKNLRAKVA